jgi:hypothetical protein
MLHYTLPCPLAEYAALQLVIDLDMTQAEYDELLQAGKYPGIVDMPNWEAVMGDRPKPRFQLTKETIGALPFPLIRYVTSGAYIGDALDRADHVSGLRSRRGARQPADGIL